jgi:hypothetical protein
MISVVYQFIAPTVGLLSVEYVLRLRGDGLHLPPQVRVMLGLITCGLVSTLLSVPSISGA